MEIFREENVPLDTQVTKLSNEYDKLCGARVVHFRGSDYTPQQMGRFSEETDRATRQEAWEANTSRRVQDRGAVDAIFDQLLALRKQIAQNAGFPDYRAYTWRQYKRFDYTPEQCLAFADSIAQTCVPLASKLARERADALRVPALRPGIWTSISRDVRRCVRSRRIASICLWIKRVRFSIVFRRSSRANLTSCRLTRISIWPAGRESSRAATKCRWSRAASHLCS